MRLGLAAALVCLTAGPVAADPCLRPWDDLGCSSYPITEADASLPLIGGGLGRGAQVSTSAGWMFRLDPSWALGPIAAVGYESEVGNSAGLGARLRRSLAPSAAVDLTAAVRLVAWDRSASRATGASLEAAIVWRDWLGAAARLEVVGPEPSLHGTVRLGSYLGLAAGGATALLVLLLQNVAFTS